MFYGNKNYDFGDDTEYKGFKRYSRKENNNLDYLYRNNTYKGIRRRTNGIYCNGRLIANFDIIKRVVRFDYSKIKDNDILEFVTVSNNSISPCSKVDFIAKAKERLQATIQYYENRLAEKLKRGKRYKNKRVHCPNCGKWFRVPRSSKRKYCCKYCATQFKNYLRNLHYSPDMLRKRDKIRWDVKKEYMLWMDDRFIDSSGRSINLGRFKDNEIKARKGKSESWTDYHKRLRGLVKKVRG